jgi:hypothetical protein
VMDEPHVAQVRLARVARMTVPVPVRGAGGATPSAPSLEALRARRVLPAGSAGSSRGFILDNTHESRGGPVTKEATLTTHVSLDVT